MKIIETTLNSKPIFALCYGGSGTGKTHFAGTLANLEKGNVLFIDIDQGVQTLLSAKDLQTKKIQDNLTLVSFDAFGDLNTAYKTIKSNDPAQWSKLLNTQIDRPFDWIVWDTWSEIQWYMLQELRKREGLLSPATPGGAAASATPNSSNDLTFRPNIQIQHWGALTDLNKLSIEALRECSVNQLFLMQESMVKDDISGAIIGGPAIHGKLVQELPAYFGVVLHTSVDLSGKFIASTKMKGKWAAKTRFAEGKEYVNPTAAEIFGLR